MKWIKLLYTKPLACIKNNGYLSDSFEILRGVRQGCPISCLIFIICMEVLANDVHQNDRIKGIKLDKSYINICQYADDATIFLQNENELATCIEVIQNFGSLSGLRLNMSKCEGLWLGNSFYTQLNCTLAGIKWPATPIKCLGIYIGQNHEECVRLNWSSKIDKMHNLLEKWKTHRNLTLFGKVQEIKCLAMSGLIYTATNCAMPSEQILKDIK